MAEQAYNGTGALKLEPEEEVVTGDWTGSRPLAGHPVGASVSGHTAGKAAHPASAGQQTASVAPVHPWQAAPALVGAILLVAAVVVLILVSYAQLVLVNDELVELRSELSELKSEETKLMSQYELAYDLQEIETQMLSAGKMNKVKNWQTYTLELSEPDSVEYYNASDRAERLTAFVGELAAGVKEYFGFGTT